MTIDHIAIAVPSISEAILQWKTAFGYDQLTYPVVNERQKVQVVFLHKPDSVMVKLIQPTDESSPIHRFVLRGGGLHHICFKCKELREELSRLTALGFRVLSQPQPGEAFENEEIAFVYANHGLNIELIATDRKARLIPHENHDK